MTIPANLGLEAAPYGPQPVVACAGQQGGPYTVRVPGNVNVLGQINRTASVTSGDQTRLEARGMYLVFNVVTNPGGAQTLELIVEIRDPSTNIYYRVLDVAPSATPGGVWLFYPGCTGGPFGDVLLAIPLTLPNFWRVRVVHSAGGVWNYGVDALLQP